MLRSKELRAKAWGSLKGKYWVAFAATILTGIIMSVGSFFSTTASDILGINSLIITEGVQLTPVEEIGFIAILGIGLSLASIGLIVSMLINGPALIGCCGFFIKNTDSKPAVTEVFSGFKTKYARNIFASLLIDIKILLWTCLFIIPGIIKAFEYAIIPYILADEPEISIKDAFAKAKVMMKGNKWRLFKLNFSFIGWFILAMLTFGIGSFFLLPYVDAANAEFYVELKNKQ